MTCLCLCWHYAALNSRVGRILQLNLPMNLHVIIFWLHLQLWIALLSSAFSCFKAYWRSNSSVWIVYLRWIPLTVSQLEGCSSFLYCWQTGPADLDASDVHRVLKRLSTSSPLSSRSAEALAAAAQRLGMSWLQRRGDDYLKLFPHWNKLEAESW